MVVAFADVAKAPKDLFKKVDQRISRAKNSKNISHSMLERPISISSPASSP